MWAREFIKDMAKNPKNTLILWLAASFSIIGFVAGFNATVDPFGYFGTNRIGYYFSSERQFKYNLVKSYDYNAILLGDSRIAYTDPAFIDLRRFRFVNGGIGGASVAEYVSLLSASRLDRLKLVVMGLHYRDLTDCSQEALPRESKSWGGARFAASWTQLRYAIEGLIFRAHGSSPRYHADGTRDVKDRYFAEAILEGKTARYWSKIQNDIPQDPSASLPIELDAKCRQLLSDVRELADRYGFAFVVVFLPRNSDLLEHLHWDTPDARNTIGRFVSEVGDIVPHVVDLSSSSFSDSRNYWLNDATHFKPDIGAQILENAIIQSIGAQAAN